MSADAIARRWAPPTRYTFWRNTANITKDLICVQTFLKKSQILDFAKVREGRLIRQQDLELIQKGKREKRYSVHFRSIIVRKRVADQKRKSSTSLLG